MAAAATPPGGAPTETLKAPATGGLGAVSSHATIPAMRRLLLPLLLGLTFALPAAAQNDGVLPKVTTRAKASRLGGIRPGVQECPEGLPADVQCMAGQDYLGAWYWMAKPKDWNGVLVLHTHDRPDLDTPDPERPARDMVQWKAWLQAGYAWASSGWRAAGYDVENAAEDSERVRTEFIGEFGEPKRVLLHGHGWGAPVATRMAQRYTTPDFHPKRGSSGKRPYDAVLLTNGQLAGARAFDAWLDLRVLYQAVCNNHPAPDEAAYPLWMGLPLNAKLADEDLVRRVDSCTGVARKPAQRSAAQQKALATLLRLTGLPEAGLLPQLRSATYDLQYLVWHPLGGKSALGNEGITYGGPGDAALNRALPRYKIDATARATLEGLTDAGGLVHVPVMTLHGQGDPVAVVEQTSFWRQSMEEAGTAAQLLQVVTPATEHDDVPPAALTAAARVLLEWVAAGRRPEAGSVAQACAGCGWRTDLPIGALATRVPERRPVASRQAVQVLGAPTAATPEIIPAAAPRAPLPPPEP